MHMYIASYILYVTRFWKAYQSVRGINISRNTSGWLVGLNYKVCSKIRYFNYFTCAQIVGVPKFSHIRMYM